MKARLMQASASVPTHGGPTTASTARPFLPSKVTLTSPSPRAALGTTAAQLAAFSPPRRRAISICAFWSSVSGSSLLDEDEWLCGAGASGVAGVPDGVVSKLFSSPLCFGEPAQPTAHV